jgi:hypothetical protein
MKLPYVVAFVMSASVWIGWAAVDLIAVAKISVESLRATVKTEPAAGCSLPGLQPKRDDGTGLPAKSADHER